ncbi:MAG: NAD(P)/FAD-dependent oxidoreductase, partial [Tannerellaceae bacterium]|nr:NAD(P)/FAD-dependent oxidoreductase [Tannerellaceae bacterium]
LVDPSDKQYYQPGFTFVAAGIYQPADVWKPQQDCIPGGVKWVKDHVVELDPVTNTIQTSANGRLVYDFLVLTPGLQINWNQVEGITHQTLGEGNAHSIYDFEGAQKTWKAIQEWTQKGGKGLFTDTWTKHKCGGAPKKICLLSEHHSRKEGRREALDFQFYTASKELYDVPFYTPRLEEIFRERRVPIQTSTCLTGVDTSLKEAHLQHTIQNGDQKVVTTAREPYEFLHFTPPMSAPDFVSKAGLSWDEGNLAAEGWVKVDKTTLIHTTYKNIVCLGDCAGIPTSKTSAAIKKQVPVAAANLIAILEGKTPEAEYNGYAACPIVTDYGHVLLCEFDYDKNPCGTFPFTLLDTSRELRMGWFLKRHILKPVYYHGMLNGWTRV